VDVSPVTGPFRLSTFALTDDGETAEWSATGIPDG
jgi:hypothetical protein